jgi:hypothetical protein
MERKRVSLVGPTLLIGLGLVLLLNNLGYLAWSIWDVLQLWPVLLIAAGLELLLGQRSIWGSLAAALLVLLLIVGGVVLIEQVGIDRGRGELVEIAHPADGVESLILDLNPAVVDLRIEPLDDSGNLVEGTVQMRAFETLDQRFTGGTRARLALGSDTRGGVRQVGMGRGPEWHLRVNPEVLTEITTDFGVGSADLLLTDLTVDEARVDFGVGQVDIALSGGTSSDIVIDGGIGTIRVIVPRSLGVRIIADAALVSRTVPGRYSREGEMYTSPNWSEADDRTTVAINLGIGSFTVVESGE